MAPFTAKSSSVTGTKPNLHIYLAGTVEYNLLVHANAQLRIFQAAGETGPGLFLFYLMTVIENIPNAMNLTTIAIVVSSCSKFCF